MPDQSTVITFGSGQLIFIGSGGGDKEEMQVF